MASIDGDLASLHCHERTEASLDATHSQSHTRSQQHTHDGSVAPGARDDETTNSTFIANALHTSSRSYYGGDGTGLSSASSNSTAVASADARLSPDATHVVDEHLAQREVTSNVASTGPTATNGYLQKTTSAGPPVEEHVVLDHGDSSDSEHEEDVATTKRTAPVARPTLQSRQSKPMTEEDLFRALSRRRTSQANGLSKRNTGATGHSADEDDEINALMSKMFGRTRQEASEEEKTRHQGVIFKHLTVKGMGIGAALQPSVGDFLLNPGRFFKNLFTKGPRKAAGKPPVRTIIDDFSGCIRPGEMVLVLGYVVHHIGFGNLLTCIDVLGQVALPSSRSSVTNDTATKR
jgi:ATP-binding cassette subfamily G (WHITE) protein 2 (SNQ2)